MKYAMSDSRTPQLLTSVTGEPWELVGFFFHDRGASTQKTLKAMLQEIMFQILTRSPRLYPAIHPEYTKLARAQMKKDPEWSVEALEKTILQLAKLHCPPTEKPINLCLFIDALDEHDGDNEKLLDLLHQLASSSESPLPLPGLTFKICLASRPWPVFQRRLGHCPYLTIDKYTKHDIESFTTEKLTRAFRISGTENQNPVVDDMSTSQSSKIRELALQITSKAAGVFIWVRIVVDELCAGLHDGTPIFLLQHVVSEMPDELADLYTRVLDKVPVWYATESRIMLQIALHSIVPLQLEVFMNCINVLLFDRVEEKGSNPTSHSLSRLATRTGGLLEVVTGPAPHSPQAVESSLDAAIGTVQFIHQTAKEYVLKDSLRHETMVPTFGDITEPRYMTEQRALERAPGNLHLFTVAVRAPKYSWELPVSLRLPILQYAASVDEMIDAGRLDVLNDFRWAFNMLVDAADILLGPIFDLEQHKGNFLLTRLTADFPRPKTKADRVMDTYIRLFGLKEAFWHNFIAIAANLHNIKFRVGSPNDEFSLVQFAAIGSRLVPQKADRVRTLKALLDSGFEDADTLLNPDSLAEKDCMSYSSSWYLSRDEQVHPKGTFTTLELLIMGKDSSLGIDEKMRLELVQVLLQSGADPNHKLMRDNLINKTLVAFCLQERRLDWAAILLRNGACWPTSESLHFNILVSILPDMDMGAWALELGPMGIISPPTYTHMWKQLRSLGVFDQGTDMKFKDAVKPFSTISPVQGAVGCIGEMLVAFTQPSLMLGRVVEEPVS
jgi:hypothetical protein